MNGTQIFLVRNMFRVSEIRALERKRKPMRCSQEKFVAEQLGQEIYLRVYNETMS